jgi:hypothetical protein
MRSEYAIKTLMGFLHSYEPGSGFVGCDLQLEVGTGRIALKPYRVYELDKNNRIFRPAQFVDADEAAIGIASNLFGCAIEIWQENRFVFVSHFFVFNNIFWSNGLLDQTHGV